MAAFNKITPEIAAQLKAVVGEKRFFAGETIDPGYSDLRKILSRGGG